jgi:hypothetical protein
MLRSVTIRSDRPVRLRMSHRNTQERDPSLGTCVDSGVAPRRSAPRLRDRDILLPYAQATEGSSSLLRKRWHSSTWIRGTPRLSARS